MVASLCFCALGALAGFIDVQLNSNFCARRGDVDYKVRHGENLLGEPYDAKEFQGLAACQTWKEPVSVCHANGDTQGAF